VRGFRARRRAGPLRNPVELSVVIPVRNGEATLRTQLDAILAQQWSGSWEVVVVDNASTDRTVALAREIARAEARVRVELVPQVEGAGAVRNAGVALARGAAFALCDADDVVGASWVAAMGDALREHDAVTGPLEVATLNPTWLVRTRGTPSASSPSTFHGSFPIMPAGNFGMRATAWDRLGGFDPAVLANEDAELSLRAWEQHIDVFFTPDAVVHYRYRDEAPVLFRQGLRYGTYRVLVARRARRAGVARVPRFAGWRSWLTLVAWLPRCATREGRASLAWVAGVRLGIARGCVRYRTLYL
jgi:glycosyltransferase involved in cell wall biosynthesis